ncbi:MAG: hypothetical protein Q9M35_01105 [Rhodothermus sp.]|nr:hypothetical protein [Rhodothermus sp.]
MWVIFDNISATILGGTLLIILISVQQRIMEINLEQITNYMVKRQANDLVSWIEEDLLRLGENVDFNNEVPFVNPIQNAATGITESFTFFRDSIDIDGKIFRIYIRYDLNPKGYRIIRGDSIPVYQLVRSVKIGEDGTWEISGRSPALISYFRIDLLDRDAKPLADPAGNPELVQNTRVRVTLVPPYETSRSQVLQRVYYGSTLLIPRNRDNESTTGL